MHCHAFQHETWHPSELGTGHHITEHCFPQHCSALPLQICNEGLKLMLKDSSTRELEEYKDKVSAVGAAFSKDNDMQGATFAYVLYKMAEHVQVEQIHNLQVSKPSTSHFRLPYIMSCACCICYKTSASASTVTIRWMSSVVLSIECKAVQLHAAWLQKSFGSAGSI